VFFIAAALPYHHNSARNVVCLPTEHSVYQATGLWGRVGVVLYKYCTLRCAVPEIINPRIWYSTRRSRVLYHIRGLIISGTAHLNVQYIFYYTESFYTNCFKNLQPQDTLKLLALIHCTHSSNDSSSPFPPALPITHSLPIHTQTNLYRTHTTPPNSHGNSPHHPKIHPFQLSRQ
jgi:hypothetical protein